MRYTYMLPSSIHRAEDKVPYGQSILPSRTRVPRDFPENTEKPPPGSRSLAFELRNSEKAELNLLKTAAEYRSDVVQPAQTDPVST